MEGNYFLVSEITHDNIINAHKYVDEHVNRLTQEGKKAAIKVVEYKSPRSISANALYWMWLTEVSNYLTKKGRDASKEDLHDLMRHKFLGYNNEKMVGKTKVERTLKSTRKLDKSAFCFYLQQVEAWAAELGCLVTSPMDCEYRRFIDKQNK